MVMPHDFLEGESFQGVRAGLVVSSEKVAAGPISSGKAICLHLPGDVLSSESSNNRACPALANSGPVTSGTFADSVLVPGSI